MSVYGGPELPNDGMSMYLDASNTKSWPGSGTVWRDLVNGLVFDATGTTQTPYQVVNGAGAMAFNGSGYWQCGTNYALVDFGGDCTLLMWLYMEDVIVRKTVFQKAGTIYNSYQQEIAVTMEVSETASYFSRYSTNPTPYDVGGTNAMTLSAWNLMGIKMSTGATAAARTGFYSKNGSAWASSYTSNTSTAVTPAGAIQLGSGYAGTMDNCKVGAVIAYNRMLSDEEVLQCFYSMRGRFGV